MTTHRNRFAVAGAIALLAAFPATAREISPTEAARAATAWTSRHPAPLGAAIGSTLPEETRTASGEDGAPLFHMVSMKGGGVVVTSAESGVEPVVAFFDGDAIGEADGNPLWEILCADMALRMRQVRAVRDTDAADPKGSRLRASATDESATPFADAEAAWADLLGETPVYVPKMASNGLSSLSDVRVSPLLQTTWTQDNGSSGASSYYTPYNYYCGCVALAGAQIARFWNFPTASRPQVTRTCYVSGSAVSKTTMGGTYAWSSMPNAFSSLTTAQKQAIGKLCYDFGVAVYMDWRSNASGAGGYCLGDAFATVFGYASAKVYCGTPGGVLSADIVNKAILSNLDAGCPVVLGLLSHEVAADGYGYASGVLYTHLNMGWGGFGNAWYNLPYVSVSYANAASVAPAASGADGQTSAETEYESTVLDHVVYNIFPSKTGDLLTGRVTTTSGPPISGASVKAVNGSTTVTTTTNSKGIYALWVTGGKTWTVTATSNGSSSSKSVSVTACVSTTMSGKSYYPGTGTVGNSWGNNFSFASAPSAPSGVSATDGTSTANCTVSWGAVSGATSYTVFRHTSNASGSATTLKTGVTGTSYADTSATPGTLYYYWIKAVGSGGTSGFSGTDSGYRKLSAPTISSATGSTTGVALSWGAVTGASYYRVFRATSATGSKTALGSWQTGTTYTDTTGADGTTYYYFVQAAVNSSGTRPSDYSAYKTGVKTMPQPANDNFASAIALAGYSGRVEGSTVGATAQSGEPLHADGGNNSVWWTWTAPTLGTMEISTLGSSFDTVLAVYTGTAVGSLAKVAANDDSAAGGTSTSRVVFDAAKGTVYRIAVAGYGGETGAVTLSWQFAAANAAKFTGASFKASSSSMHVAFKAKKGFSYQVQRCQTLGGTWTTVKTVTPSASGTIETDVPMPSSWKSGFVRIVTVE